MGYVYVLFDLDGTLTDHGIGITNSVIYALKKYGIEVTDRHELYKFIGPPLTESFEVYYGFSNEEAKRAVEYYREYFQDKGMFENLVYDGIEDLLQTLKDEGRKLIVATSKPGVFAEKILDHFKLSQYFTGIVGSNLDGTRVKKYEVIKYVLDNYNITDLSKAIMIGDREHDVIGAKEAGLKCIGVLFGYGSQDELEKAGAHYIAETVGDIGKIIAG